MALHWTYRDAVEKDLLQGDILERTDSLIAVLDRYHRYFCREQYTGFLVLTQSCDLARGGGECKAPYINIAVIRDLEPLLPELLKPVCGSGIENVYLEEDRWNAIDALRKVINQNDQARGLFYLHPVSTENRSLRILATPSVGLLRVNIALRREHYDILLNARRYHLESEYANKLGWLSGNLFSRVATRDWEDQERDPDASLHQCKRLLSFVTELNGENWVPRSWLDAAKKRGMNPENIKPSIMRSELNAVKPQPPFESAADVVASIAERTISDVTEERILQELASSEAFNQQVAHHCVSLVEAELEGAEAGQLRQALIDAEYGATLAGFVVRTMLRDFNHRDLPIQELGDFLGRQCVGKDTVKILGTQLRAIVEDTQRVAEIRNSASGKPLFSETAIRMVEDLVRVYIPALRLACVIAKNIGKRVKGNGKFKDAFRSAGRS